MQDCASIRDSTGPEVMTQLRQELALYQGIVEGLGDMVFVKDLQGRYVSLNNSCATIIGKPKAEIIGKNDRELFGNAIAEQIAAHEAKLIEQGGSIQYELPFPWKDTTYYFQSQKYLLHNGNGAITGIVGVSRNATKEKLAESKYRFIFDNAPVAFWEEDFSQVKVVLDELRKGGVKDFRTYFKNNSHVLQHCVGLVRIVDVNLATMRMNRTMNKPKFITELKRTFTEESYSVFIEEFAALAEGRTFFQSEASTVEVDGEKLDVLFNVNVLPGHEDDLSQVLVSVVDVSALKRTEGQLSQIKELYRSVVEGQREMICRFLPSGKVTFYNTAFERFFSKKELDMANIHFQDLFPEGGSHQWVDEIAQPCLRPMFSIERHNYDRDGNMVWQVWSITAIFDANNEVTEFQAVGTDISESKATKEQLAASEARWRSVFEHAEDLILTVNSTGLILSANEQASAAAGQKLAGRMISEILGEESSLIAERAIDSVFESAKRVKMDVKLTQGPAAGRLLSCVITPIFQADRVLSATVIARDITESKELENQIREALIAGQEEERKRVSRELHDGLGQLFTAIKMNMEHLRSGLNIATSENMAERLQILEETIAVAINEVKHISQDLMPDMLEQYGLRPALHGLVKNWNDTGKVNITLEVVDLTTPLDRQIELALFRIAQELITNAVRHSQATSIFVQLIDHGDTLLLMVEDDGIGFDPSQRSNGHGLRNIRSRAELLDGSVEIDSAIGRGTVTTLEIPLRNTNQ